MRLLSPVLLFQVLISSSITASTSISPTSLLGRFLHLTDLHPDPYYTTNSLESTSCHSLSTSFNLSQSSSSFSPSPSPSSDDDRLAGYFGLPISNCDSPPALINATLSFLSKHFKHQFDFIVWTGDNARHDIDEGLPRTQGEIQELNRFVAEGIRESFGDKVKVVASLGNNDVWPHNIMFPGPSELTNSMLSLWRSHQFIPEQMRHTFSRGGYYSLPLAHDQLLLVSLNTIYFFEKNTAVDGCPLAQDTTQELDPGSEQLLWLEQQLYLAREGGMKVWLTGHVPPNEANWYQGCLMDYTKLSLEYNDIILGQLFGHMNQDHFSFLTNLPSTPAPLSSSAISTLSSDELPSTLYHLFKSYNLTSLSSSQLSKLALNNFSTITVNPSVIPTYLPSFRIYEYQLPFSSSSPTQTSYLTQFISLFSPSLVKPKIQPFTPTSYTQFYIPLSSLSAANECAHNLLLSSSPRDSTFKQKMKSCQPSYEISYTTLPSSIVISRLLSSPEEDQVFKPSFMPRSIRSYLNASDPNPSRRRLEELLRVEDVCPFELEELSTKEWLGVAKGLVESKRGKKGRGMWRGFVERMGVRSEREEL